MAMNESTRSTATSGTTAAEMAGFRLVTYFSKTPIIKDQEGNEIGKGQKPADVVVNIPDYTAAELATYLAAADGSEEAKIRDLIIDGVRDVIFLAGRRQINEWRENNPDKVFLPSDMDVAKLTLQAIANMPKGQRGAWSPSEDDMKSFLESYTEVLLSPAVSYDAEKTATHCSHYKSGFSKLRAAVAKPVIEKLKEFLTVWLANADEESIEENMQTYEWLVARADKYLKAEEKDYLAAV